MGWLGGGDVAAAVAAVRPALRTQQHPAVDVGDLLDAEAIALFDRLYDQIRKQRVLPAAMLGEMNALHARLPAPWKAAWSRRLSA